MKKECTHSNWQYDMDKVKGAILPYCPDCGKHHIPVKYEWKKLDAIGGTKCKASVEEKG